MALRIHVFGRAPAAKVYLSCGAILTALYRFRKISFAICSPSFSLTLQASFDTLEDCSQCFIVLTRTHKSGKLMDELLNQSGVDVEATPGSLQNQRRRTRFAAYLYPVAWIAGLSVTSASTDVTSTGATVLQEFGSHRMGLILQLILTEGVAAIALVVVLASMKRIAAGQGRLARIAMYTGMAGAVISLLQCLTGIWLATMVVPTQDASTAGLLKDILNRADGVKMFLFAAMSWSGTLLFRRRGLAAMWLKLVAMALTASIVVSGIGYLLLNSFMAYAAWISLPLLLVWVTGVGIALSASSTRAGRSI